MLNYRTFTCALGVALRILNIIYVCLVFINLHNKINVFSLYNRYDLSVHTDREILTCAHGFIEVVNI